jgi:hypothetical protein
MHETPGKLEAVIPRAEGLLAAEDGDNHRGKSSRPHDEPAVREEPELEGIPVPEERRVAHRERRGKILPHEFLRQPPDSTRPRESPTLHPEEDV